MGVPVIGYSQFVFLRLVSIVKRDREHVMDDWIEQTYSDNHKILYRYAEVLVSYHCRAMYSCIDDLVQETFFILYKKRHKLYSHENITGWLIVALRYNFNNRWRKMKRRNEILMEPNMAEQFSGDKKPVEDAIFRNDDEALSIIRVAIKDEDKYQAFIDFHVKHVPIQDLADKYGKSYDAMKMQLYRSRKFCKILLEESGKFTVFFLLLRVTFFDFMT